MSAAMGPAAVVASKAVAGEASSVVRAVLSALEKPIYSNLNTTMVTHVARNGDVVVRTRTKGWTIPLGLAIGVLGATLVWEVGKDVSQAFGKNSILSASGALSAPNLVAFGLEAESGALPYVALYSAAAQAWDWLDGAGATHKDPPSTTIKVVPMPATAMAGLDGLLATALGGATGPLSAVVPRLVAELSP